MTHWKSNNLWLEQKTGQVYMQKKYFIESYKHYTGSNSKQEPEEKELKTVGYIAATMDHCPRNG